MKSQLKSALCRGVWMLHPVGVSKTLTRVQGSRPPPALARGFRTTKALTKPLQPQPPDEMSLSSFQDSRSSRWKLSFRRRPM